MKTRTWLSVPVAAVLALGGAASAYGSEDAGDIDDETVLLPGVDGDDNGGGGEQSDLPLFGEQEPFIEEAALFGGQLR